jgi:hypothetical protein
MVTNPVQYLIYGSPPDSPEILFWTLAAVFLACIFEAIRHLPYD